MMNFGLTLMNFGQALMKHPKRRKNTLKGGLEFKKNKILIKKTNIMATFPVKEGDLNTYFGISTNYIKNNKVRLLVSADNDTLLSTLFAAWETRYPLAVNEATSTKTAVYEKDETAIEMKKVLRVIFGDIPSSVLTATDRDTLLIPVSGGAHSNIPLTNSHPNGAVDASKRLQHKLTILDNDSSKKAHPHGVSACEVWQKIGGDKPLHESELSYVGSTSTDVFYTDFTSDSAGLMVYYWVRWVNIRNERGTWGPEFWGNVQG